MKIQENSNKSNPSMVAHLQILELKIRVFNNYASYYPSF